MFEKILLNLLWILPFLTVLFSIPIKENSPKLKRFHLASAGVVLLSYIYLLIQVFQNTISNTSSQIQLLYETKLNWLNAISAKYFIGIDALSSMMLVLAAIIIFTGILATWRLEKGQKVFLGFFQILAASVYGVFISFDLVLFFVFYEMEALCMYLLIAGYGSGNKDYGAKKLTLTLAIGSSMILAVFLGIYAETGTWNLIELSKIALPESFQYYAFPILFLGFAVSSSLFPFHFWSPAGHSAAPTAVSMFAAGVMMKMGAYGCLRIAIYLMPEGAKIWLPYLLIFIAFNVIIGPFIAMRHKDLKFITAYSSISHLGLIFLGLAAMTPLAFRGAALQMISHGFLTGLFFATIGMIYSRTHTRDITQMGGLMKAIPFIGVGFVIAGFAGLGLPGLSGFVAEATIFIGSFENPSPLCRVITILAILSITATAIYILRCANKMLHGPLVISKELLPKTLPEEKFIIVSYVICLIILGIFPMPFAKLLDSSIYPIYMNLIR